MEVENWLKSELSLNIWRRKYQYNNESFEQWLDRISGGDEQLRNLIKEKKFLFGGRILSNRGLYKEGIKCTYSNCYVLEPPKDNLESIYDTAKQLARTFSYGGGVGIDISQLRPKGAIVNNSARHTTGAVSFMPTYSDVTGTIGQNGRRGALMISMSVSHPDIEEFIDIKRDLDQVTKANISVRVDKQFMEAVKNEDKYVCHFTVEDTGEVITKVVDAKKLFMRLCENNWDFAEPGILFWDNIENSNLVSEYTDFKYSGVNPCAEEPLPSGGSCLLGSLNLSAFVKYPFTGDAYFDISEFKEAIYTAVKGLNDVLDEGLALHPLTIQQETVRDWRQIGLGVMGIADMLIKLNLGYGTKEANLLCSEIAYCLSDNAIRSSSLLAMEQGTFPKYHHKHTMESKYFERATSIRTKELVDKYGLRNSQILTIAPTGSLSTMLEISGGIEPIFNTSYTRKTESLGDGDQYYKVYTPIIKQYMDYFGYIVEDDLPENIRITAMNLDPMARVAMQATWQQYIDASISSTVNLPNEATIEDVFNIYMQAYEQGLKGITVYRDGCQRSAVLTNTTPKKEEKKEEPVEIETNTLPRGYKKEIAKDTVYFKRPVHIGCGKLNLFIGYSPSERAIQDLYIKKSGNGGCEKNLETTVIGISLILRLGGNLKMVEHAFSGISTCSSFTRARGKGHPISKGSYCGNAILNVVDEFMKDLNIPEANLDIPTYEGMTYVSLDKEVEPVSIKPTCPECGEEVSMVEGCMTCPSCGYSKCN